MTKRIAAFGLLLVVGAALDASPAQAEAFHVTLINGEVLIAADRDSIRRVGDRATVRTIELLAQPEQASSVSYQEALRDLELDCRARRFRQISATFHTSDGVQVAHDSTSKAWDDVPPGTPVARTLAMACDGVLPTETAARAGALAEVRQAYRSALRDPAP